MRTCMEQLVLSSAFRKWQHTDAQPQRQTVGYMTSVRPYLARFRQRVRERAWAAQAHCLASAHAAHVGLSKFWERMRWQCSQRVVIVRMTMSTLREVTRLRRLSVAFSHWQAFTTTVYRQPRTFLIG